MRIGGPPSAVKQLWSVLSGVLKSKANAVKGKAAHGMKATLVAVSLVKNKKIFGAISHKMNSLFGNEESRSHNLALMAYHVSAADDDDIPCEILQLCEQEMDQSHALIESETHSDNPRNSVSVIECPQMSTSSVEDGIDILAEDFIRRFHNTRMSTSSVEDGIDILAEDFIRRFHNQMVLQKQNSFQRYREMLDRSV